MSVLEEYAWPGNVRELKHVLEQALVEAQGMIIERESLEHALRVQQGAAATPSAQPVASSVKDRIRRAWLDELRELYHQYGGNISKIARVAGRDRRTVRKDLQEMGEHTSLKEQSGRQGLTGNGGQ
jgi:DNA-binding NtrC family response regulator